jgi:hypothetical protein
MSLVEQELLPLPEHSCSPSALRRVLISQSLLFSIFSILRIIVSIFHFSIAVFFFSINDFWLPLWYLQTFLSNGEITLHIILDVCKIFITNSMPVCASLIKYVHCVLDWNCSWKISLIGYKRSIKRKWYTTLQNNISSTF